LKDAGEVIVQDGEAAADNRLTLAWRDKIEPLWRNVWWWFPCTLHRTYPSRQILLVNYKIILSHIKNNSLP